MSRSGDWSIMHGRWHHEPCQDCDGAHQDSKMVFVQRETYVLRDERAHGAEATTHAIRVWWFADPTDMICGQCRSEWDAEMQREAALAAQLDWERMMAEEDES